MFLSLAVSTCHGSLLSCKVIVGPTGDSELTEANLTWTRQVVERVRETGQPCDVLFIDAWARANKMFAERQADVLFPEIVDDPGQPGITGTPIALTYGFVVFNLKPAPQINSIAQLEGKTVGLIRGRYYPETLTTDTRISFQLANSLEQNFNKLHFGRIDATVDYVTDGLRLLNRMGLANKVQHGSEFGVEKLAYRFHDTADGHNLQTLFDQAIAELRAEGVYHQSYQGTSQRLLP